MATIEVPSTLPMIQTVLGDSFQDNPSLLYGASHSGHGVRFGEYEGVEVAVKPYWGRKAHDNAKREGFMTRRVAAQGFATLRVIGVHTSFGEEECFNLATLMTEYVGDAYAGGNTLTLEEDPSTPKGKLVAEAVGSIVTELAGLHNKLTTHGDSQVKNFMLNKLEPTKVRPLVIDLEKANAHDSKRIPGVIARPEEFAGE